MEVRGFWRWGLGPEPPSSALSPFSLTFCLFPHLVLSPSQQQSWQIEHILDINEQTYTCTHTLRTIFPQSETWWLSFSVTCPIYTGLELPGDLVWFRLYPHVWVSCISDQISRIISRFDWMVHLHASAAMNLPSLHFLHEKPSACYVWSLRWWKHCC